MRYYAYLGQCSRLGLNGLEIPPKSYSRLGGAPVRAQLETGSSPTTVLAGACATQDVPLTTLVRISWMWSWRTLGGEHYAGQ